MEAAPRTAARRPGVVLRLEAPVDPHHVPRLVERLPSLLAGRELVVCELAGRPDLATVDVLARLLLLARRRGCTVRVRGEVDGLRALLRLAGLQDALADPLEPRGQAEPCEQLRVEEVVDVHDLTL